MPTTSALVEESLARYRALGDAFGLADALNTAALLRWYAGDAVLLQSGCTLLTARDPAAPHPLAPGARHELTLALLAAAQKSAPADPLTHAQAARLLAREYGKTSSAVPPTSPVRPVRQLAGEMVGAPARTQAQVASPRAD